jgi:hypothetical protein
MFDCLSKPVKVTDNNKTLAYYKICPFHISYEFVTFFIIQAPNNEQGFIFFVTYEWTQ